MKSPGYTFAVVLTLALGIGATTAIFSILHATLLRPLPYRDSDKLVAIWGRHQKQPDLAKIFNTYQDYLEWRDSNRSFEEFAVATWFTRGETLTRRGPARQILAIPVSANFFSLLGVHALKGRVFEPADLSHGCAVVLSHRFWLSQLGAPPGITGETLTLSGKSCSVVGLMPASFNFYPESADLWTLILSNNGIARTPEVSPVGLFARLKPGVTLSTAQRELDLLYQRSLPARHKDRTEIVPVAYPLRDEFTWLTSRSLRSTLLVLFASVLAILCIGCANVVNLMLSRGLRREKEFAVRAALGSGARGIIILLLTEGLLLSSLGAGIGLLLATAALAWFRKTNPVDLPPGAEAGISWAVLGFAVLLSVSTAMVFSLVPAWRASRANIESLLRGTSRGVTRGPGGQRIGQLLVVGEVALSLSLLTFAGLLIQSLLRFSSAPSGFDATRLISFRLPLPPDSYSDPGKRAVFYERAIAEVRTLPAVEGAAYSTQLPFHGSSVRPVLIEGRTQPEARLDTNDPSVSEDYFRVLGLPLLKGRSFNAGDRLGAPEVAIVNTAFVRGHFGAEDPLGKRIKLGKIEDSAPWLTIVGIAADDARVSLYDEMRWTSVPFVYRPFAQSRPTSAYMFVRTAADPRAFLTAIPRTIARVDDNVPVWAPETLEDQRSRLFAYPRFRAMLLIAFAGIGLLLAVVGLYGVVSQLTQQRWQEFGIRLALGADSGNLRALVMRQGLSLAAAGLLLGAGLSWYGTTLISTLLFRTAETNNAPILAAVCGILLLSTLAAAYLPARRAARLDPVAVLRSER